MLASVNGKNEQIRVIDLAELPPKERIRHLMSLKGRSLAGYARELGVSSVTIYDVIRRRTVSRRIQDHIAADLGWPADELFDLERRA